MLTNTTHANPGHALEAGWFLLQFAGEDKELQNVAVDKFVELPYERGWDSEHGGLFYFLDVDGLCPTQVSPPPPPLISSCYSAMATRERSLPSANKKNAVFPEQLEWSMKLWWPHCEALIAFLMAYSQTRRPQLLERFFKVFQYTFSHVSQLVTIFWPTAICPKMKTKEFNHQ